MSLFSELMQPHPTPISIEDGKAYDRTQVYQQVHQLADRLTQLGIGPNRKVALVFFNQQTFITSFLALWQIGAVIVPINLQLPPDDIAYVLTHAGVELILATDVLAERLHPLPITCWLSNGIDGTWEQQLTQGNPNFTQEANLPIDSVRLLIYTSGTTGKPKGVMLSEGNLQANLDDLCVLFPFTTEDLVLHALPMFHAFGLIIMLLTLRLGTPLLLVPKFAPHALLNALMGYPVTVLPLVPTLFSLLVQGIQQAGQQPTYLKYCISGGATLPPSLLQQVEAVLGCPILEGYGLTETSPVIAVNTPNTGSRSGSVGRPLSRVTVSLRNEEGLPVQGPNEVGEICVKAPTVMLGYYRQPEETMASFTDDGYFKTGDLGHLDAEGFLSISGGRKKDLIIKAGENLSPVRIEMVFYQHPAVVEACVFGVPDSLVGEEVMAAVVLRSELTEAELKRHGRQHLPSSMVPKQVFIVDQLPKNAVGKVVRSALIDLLKPILQPSNTAHASR